MFVNLLKNSLESLFLPAKISKEYDIHVGDVFKVGIVKENDSIKIIYELVYKD